jgi:hypothetical protein
MSNGRFWAELRMVLAVLAALPLPEQKNGAEVVK